MIIYGIPRTSAGLYYFLAIIRYALKNTRRSGILPEAENFINVLQPSIFLLVMDAAADLTEAA